MWPHDIIDIDSTSQQFKFVHQFNNINEIQIELMNKDINDTQIEGNRIIDDLYITIDSLKIDSLNFIDKLSKISQYIGENGMEYNTNNFLNYNGVMTIKFIENPLYTHWLTSLS